MIVIMSSSSLIERLSSLAEGERALRAGEVLFSAGQPVKNVYVVLKGSVRLVRRQASGSAVVLQRATAGDLLAEASLFAARYHCDAVADTPTQVARVAISEVRRLQSEDPRWLTDLAVHLAREVQEARARAEVLSLKTVRERLEGWRALHGSEIPPRGRWLELAQEIGVSPEALYRELARARSSRRA